MDKTSELHIEGVGLYRKFAQDIGIIGVANTVIALRGLVILPIIAKILGASGYGVWSQAHVTLALIAPFCELNLSAAFARFLAAEEEREKIREGLFSVAFFALGWGLIIGLILFLLRVPLASALFRDTSAVPLVNIIAIIVPFWALNIVGLGFFRAFRLMKVYSMLSIGQKLGEVTILAFFVLSGFGMSGALTSVLIAYVLIDIVIFCIIISRIGIRLPKFVNIKQYLRFSLPTVPGLLSSWVVNSSDRYVIGFFLGVAPIGIYSAGYSLGHIIWFFIAPLGFVLLPTLSKLYDENSTNELRAHMTYSVKYFLMIAVPAAFGLSVLAKPLLHILSTAEIAATGAMVVPLVAAAGLVWGIYVVYGQAFILVKRTALIGIMWGTAAAVNLGLNIIVVPVIGAFGAAITTLVAYSGVTVATIILSRRYVKFDVNLVFMLKSVLASVVMSLVIWKLNPAGIASVVWVIVLGAVIYFVILFLVKGFSKGEIRFFKRLFTSE